MNWGLRFGAAGGGPSRNGSVPTKFPASGLCIGFMRSEKDCTVVAETQCSDKNVSEQRADG
jgi:hypothetical protein